MEHVTARAAKQGWGHQVKGGGCLFSLKVEVIGVAGNSGADDVLTVRTSLERPAVLDRAVWARSEGRRAVGRGSCLTLLSLKLTAQRRQRGGIDEKQPLSLAGWE